MTDDTQMLARQIGEALQANDRTRFVDLMRRLVAARAPMNQGWKSLTQPLLDFGELGLARQSIDLYVAANPGSAEARFEQALIYTRTARADDAYAILGDLPRSVPDVAGNAYLRGTIALNLGRMDDAREAVLVAHRQRPTSGQIFQTLSALGSMAAMPDIAEIILAAERPMESAEEGEQAPYLYALGKTLDELGEHDRAFAAFARGAALIAARRSYDATADAAGAAQAIAGWDRATIDRIGAEVSLPTSDAIIVTGLPRSGSTLVEQILVSHSAVEDGDELGRFALVARDVGGVSSDRLQRWLGRHRADEATGLYQHLFRERFAGTGRAVDKSLEASRYLGLLAALLPEAPILWLRRDPFDNGWSAFSTYFLVGLSWSWSQLAIAAHFKIEDELFNYWRAVLGDRLMPVSYEELVSDKLRMIPALLNHCRLDLEPATLEPHNTERLVTTNSVAQVRQPISPSAIGKANAYRTHLEPFIAAYGYRG